MIYFIFSACLNLKLTRSDSEDTAGDECHFDTWILEGMVSLSATDIGSYESPWKVLVAVAATQGDKL